MILRLIKYRIWAFADNGGKINARKNWIKVTDGATNIASINGAKIDLEGGKIEYKGKGYALYTDSTSSSSDAINNERCDINASGKVSDMFMTRLGRML